MQNSSDLLKSSELHHFNIIEGGTESLVSEICTKVLNFDTNDNLKYQYKKYDILLVDDARDLIERQNIKYSKDDSVVFVVETNTINSQAQNALLKICEDPGTNIYLFLLIPQTNILLPTFLSRAIVYKNILNNQGPSDFVFPNLSGLRNMKISDRMDLVTKWIGDYKKNKIQKSQLKKFLKSLVVEMEQELLKGEIRYAKKLKNINRLISYFDNNGSNLKSLLEFTMLSV